MKVRIHLNLANPELAESVIKIKSKNNTWVTVAYATKINLVDVSPFIDIDRQKKINEGLSKKNTPCFF